jgi:outer membrane immunogenic protein
VYRNKLAILASTALGVIFGFAQTADAAPPAPYSWTGFYLGGNLGYSWGKADTTADVAPFTHGIIFTPGYFVFPGGSSFLPLRPDGFIGGGQIGYNWQFAPAWLAGIEADWQWSGQKDSRLGIFSGSAIPCGYFSFCNFTNTTDITAKLSWFGTVRGRVGALWNNMLVYGTGGVAYGRVSVSGTNTFSFTDVAGPTTVTYSTPFSYSRTKVGWTAGAGIEGVIRMSNWTWKVEYLHIDLGSIGGGSFGSVPVVTLNTGKFTDEIVRIGFNYRL